MKKTLGILGGMGPLASAEFLGTLYRLNVAEFEQDTPACVLLSDPTFPDRTEAILAGSTQVLAQRLEEALQTLLDMGADPIVIACVTVHHVLPQVPAPLRRRVLSLLDLVADEVLAAPRPRLLLATNGTRAARIFESHERWREIEPWTLLPGEEDQRTLHDCLYRLKAGAPGNSCIAWLKTLPRRYGTEGFVFGCTELHLLHRYLEQSPGELGDIIDPLWTVAREFSATDAFLPVAIALVNGSRAGELRGASAPGNRAARYPLERDGDRLEEINQERLPDEGRLQ
jgi:aspartate racemase